MNLLRITSEKNESDTPRLNSPKEFTRVKGKVRHFGSLLITLFFFANQAFCQDEVNSRLKDLSGTYFIDSESQIAGNIKRRIQLEEDHINGTESVVSIVSDGQEVFSGRRHNQSPEISGTWSYVHSSQDPQLNQLQKDRSCTITVGADGEKLTLTMRQIKFRPAGGLFVGMMQAIDQSSKGVDANTAASNVKWEIAFEKSTSAIDSIDYIRRKAN